MSVNKTEGSSHYDNLVARQVEQYRETDVMHDLPLIQDYWSEKYSKPNALKTIGYDNIIDLYAGNFQKSLQQSNSTYLISIGSGDCSIEIDIVQNLIARNETNFKFVCLELSPILIEKGRKKIAEQGLEKYISVEEIDINKWEPAYSFAGVMAHHALHHFLELETLFRLIKENLAPNGRFVTCDMIGRNGHMRWPEALGLTRAIWQRLPRKYKYHHSLKKYDDYFENWDCAIEGFEGIRAEDILPLLVQLFYFETFYAYGNLIDPFLDRGFGPNYDPEKAEDVAFIDYLHTLNESLIDQGLLKPTAMMAVMVNEPVEQPNVYKNWTPEFSVRRPGSPAPEFDILPLLDGIPYQVTSADDPLIINRVGNYTLGTKLLYTNSPTIDPPAQSGIQFLKNGWTYAPNEFTWSVCEEAAIILPLAEPVEKDVQLSIEFVVYCSPVYPHTNVEVIVNNTSFKTLVFENTERIKNSTLDLVVPASLLTAGKIELNFVLPHRRPPQYEHGDDLRAVGIGLIAITVNEAVEEIAAEPAPETFYNKLRFFLGKKSS